MSEKPTKAQREILTALVDGRRLKPLYGYSAQMQMPMPDGSWRCVRKSTVQAMRSAGWVTWDSDVVITPAGLAFTTPAPHPRATTT
jgi:hypothetical protein